MLNEQIYIKNLDEVSQEKFKIEECTGENVKKLKKIFKNTTGFAGKYLKLVVDFLTSNDIESFDKKYKILKLFDDFGTTYTIYKLLGKENTFNEYLSNKYGIKTMEISENFIKDKFDKNIEDETILELYQRYTLQGDSPKTAKEFVNGVIKETINIKTSIDKNDELINKKAEEVEVSCKITKSNFIKSLNLKVKQLLKGKDEMNEEIKKIQDDYANFNEAISVLK